LELTASSVVVASRDQLSSDLGGETVLLHMGAGRYYGLDEVGTRVWALIQRPRRVGEVCAEIVAEYEVDAGRCERAVLTLLAEMADAGLVERVDGPAS
jgi:hypothetical protein